ncbi:MAG: hypothetical protein H7176_06840 [Bdellovibrionales bacterium]|nr:hypothetical protein [Massilia sp.]
MHSKLLTLCVAAAIFAIPAASHAQLGNGGGTYADVTGVSKWIDVMPRFVDAAQDALAADANLLAALGMPEQAAAVMSRSKEMTVDATAGTVEEIMVQHSAAVALLAPKLAASGVTLSEADKVQLSKGIDGLARALVQIDALSTDLPGLKKMMRDSGAKARTGYFVSKSLALYRAEMKQELRAAIAFAKANSVPFPPDAEIRTAQ